MSASSTPLSNNRSRVKLYTLNDERQWDDRGTGFVTCTPPPTDSASQHSIIVKSEIDNSTLLESEIQLHTKYQKQQETLIVWSEGEKYDLALSFQEKLGCDEIWENICLVQGRDSSSLAAHNPDPSTESVVYESDDDGPLGSNETYLSPTITLPPIDLAHLRDLCDFFTPEKVRDPSRRDLLARAIESGNCIRKLVDLFHVCEDLENRESLHQIYEIIRSIFYLNKSSLFEILFSEEFIFDIIGCLEYEPHLIFKTKRNHRDFLTKKATFKEVIPIGNQELLAKIHQTYRVQYIQDAILPAPSLFEENLLSTMNNILYINKVEIVTLLYENPKFLNQLFATLRDDHVSEEKRKDLMLFLKEFCVFSQTLQQQSRDHFFQALATHGILNVIQVILNLDDTITKQAALDVFASIVECNPSTVREYMLQETQSIQDDDELLLNLVISEIRCDPDPELSGALHLMNYLKLLIDPDNMLAVSIMAPLMANTIDHQLARDDFRLAQLENLILDFVTFCLEHHTYHMRNFLNKKDFLRRILVLLKSKHQFLQLSALRFIRKLIGLKDEQYNIIIVRSNLFSPIVDAFKANKRRYNLLNSALIELFEFIRQEDIQSLIHYFIENFYSDFQSVSYVKTFQGLKSRYDAYRDRKERMLSGSSPTSSTSRFHENFTTSHLFPMQRLRKDERELDVDEENWFNLDADDQPSSSIHSNTLFNSTSDDDPEDEENENNNDDDEDEDENSQPDITASAISTSEPPPSRVDLNNSDGDDDEERLPIPSPSDRSKPIIHIHIRRSPTSSSSSTPPMESSSTESQHFGESPSPYAMSPALSSIADQYNDDDDDDDEDNEDVHNVSSNAESGSSLATKKRPIDDDDDDDDHDDENRQNKLFKGTEDQS